MASSSEPPPGPPGAAKLVPAPSANLFIAPRLARPVEADEQRREILAQLANLLAIGLAAGHRVDPAVVLFPRRRDVSPPPVARDEHIGDRSF